MKKKNYIRVFAGFLVAALLLTMIPAFVHAEDANAYKLYDEFGGNAISTDSYFPDKPEMLPVDMVKDGYVFGGWYQKSESAGDNQYVAEMASVTKYYNTSTVEKTTSSPDFNSDTAYFVKAESYAPALTNGAVRRIRLSANETAPDGLYIIAYGTILSYTKSSKLVVGSPYYLDLYNYYAAYKGKCSELDAVIPSGYNGSISDVYMPVTMTAAIKSDMETVAPELYQSVLIDAKVLANAFTNTSNRTANYILYEKASTLTPVTAATYTSGSVVYYETEKTEISAAEYDASNPNHSVETVETPTGAFRPASASDTGVRYNRVSMTPATAMGEVDIIAGWIPVSAAPSTFILDFAHDDLVSVPMAYDPSAPVSLGTPAMFGYAFKGWLNNEGAVVDKTPAVPGENITFTASWEEMDVHTVSFMAGGHGEAPADIRVVDGDLVAAPDSAEWTVGYVLDESTQALERKYTFCGWFKDAALTEQYDFSTPVTEDITLFAKWTFGNYIPSMVLSKTYNDSFRPAEGITTENIFTETISYTITAEKSENREVGKTEIPEIAPADITVGDGSDNVVINFPDFNAPEYGIGDYWYKIVETAGATAGVTYDTHVYYLHLVVADQENGKGAVGVISYGLHTDAEDGVKKDGFTNIYNAGALTVNKQVTGNMGDPDKLFKVTVTLTAPAGKTVMGDISYVGGFADEAGNIAYTDAAPGVIPANWTGSKSVDVFLKDDATVSFANIPEGVTYTVVEADYSADGYTATYAIDSEAAESADSAADDKVNGSITDLKDAVTITNDKTVAVDVGVVIDNIPYIAMMLLVVTTLVAMFPKKRRSMSK